VSRVRPPELWLPIEIVSITIFKPFCQELNLLRV
jgi:hypothetical protein